MPPVFAIMSDAVGDVDIVAFKANPRALCGFGGVGVSQKPLVARPEALILGRLRVTARTLGVRPLRERDKDAETLFGVGVTRRTVERGKPLP